MEGDYAFKRHGEHGIVSLRTFVEQSYLNYANYYRSSLTPLNFSVDEYNLLLGFSIKDEALILSKEKRPINPYADIPDVQFWKKSLVNVPREHVDPVISPKFKIIRHQRIATAGSCFAQHISRTLNNNGFNYFVTEVAPIGLDDETAYSKNYGVFSARYGNIYTVRQLTQLIERVFGSYHPEDAYWIRKDGKFVDPFRPHIEPDGFIDIEAVENSRRDHFLSVRKMVEEMDIFIFTLGLTEGWRSRHDGAVFPLAPGVAGCKVDVDRYEFVNFSVEDVTSDLEKFIAQIATINPKCKVILTVSPVPLIATYEASHALVATTYSKAVLRVAAENIKSLYSNVEYFPSYEIITGAFNKGGYFEDDLRSVAKTGIDHVMRLFLKHYLTESHIECEKNLVFELKKNEIDRARKLFEIVCDEESIVKFE